MSNPSRSDGEHDASDLACPKCGSPMVIRTRRRDRAQFWGCPKYPACHGTRSYGAMQAMRPGDVPEPVPGAIPWDDPSWQRAAAGHSARATYDRRLLRHRERIRQRRPRILLSGATFVLVGVVLLGMPATWPMLGMALIFLGVVSTATRLFVTPSHVRAWTIGAGGEERVGELLAPLEADGFRILHDRRRPGGRENIDHIVIGPPGVVVVETKRYPGSVRVRGRDLYLKGRRHTEFVDQVRRQVDSLEASLGVTRIAAIICVVDGEFPLFGSRSVGGIELVSHRSLTKTLRSMPVALDTFEIDRLANQADRLLMAAGSRAG